MGLKVLGQSAPSVGTDTILFTAGSQTVVSTLFAANRATNSARFSVAVVPSGETLGSKHWVYSQILCPPNDTFAATVGFALASGDSVVVWTNGTMSFSAFGEDQ
jgi:hypothetical protein